MNVSLSGKTAVVCGSTQGIGLAIAHELALLGAKCILLARNKERLEVETKQLPTPENQVHRFEQADFSDTDSVQQAIQKITATEMISVLINNTGGPAAGPIITATEEAFTNAFQQHLICNHLLTLAVIPGMKSSGYGRIINVISTSVKIPLPNLGVSNTIRGAVASWAKTMSNELAPFGITVNNVLPGFIKTGRLQTIIDKTADSKRISTAEAAAEMMESIPMKRFGDTAEIAALTAFLASPAASYITGVSIPVDGGRTGSL